MKIRRRTKELDATRLTICNRGCFAFAGSRVAVLLFVCITLSSCNQTPVLASELWQITHYDACFKCCGKTDGITASGKLAKTNHTIACNWLPFGAKVKIGNKIYTVEDRGSSKYFGTKKNPIKHIDVYVSSHQEAIKLGIKYMKVEIL